MLNNTLLDTNLNIDPYFDDFDKNSDQYRVLVKPATAVQTREINQIQAILQEQIGRFGRNIYKEGSVVEGCVFTFDSKRAYVKITDAYVNSSAFTIGDFTNQYIYNSNGLKALVVDTKSGYLSQAPNTNTLYIKYLNSATYGNGAPQTKFDNSDILTITSSANIALGQIQVANVANTVGYGYSMSTTEGIVFKKGIFCYVAPQTVLVTPYSNSPDQLAVGFNTEETIETALSNNALYDNAAGAPNFGAPGADRLKIVPKLTVRDLTSVSNSSSFFALATFREGSVVTINQTAAYSGIGDDMARRTYETNGDFVVNPFTLTTQVKANTSDPKYTNYVNLIASKGTGYVEGYRVEYLNNNIVDLRKGTDYANVNQQTVSINSGNYLFVNELAGEFGDPSFIVPVQLHNVAKTAVSSGTNLSTAYSSTTQIGTAYVRGFEHDAGTPGTPSRTYRLYLFNISMYPGQNFNNIKSILYVDSSTLEGIADVDLTYNYTANSNFAQLQDVYSSSLIFPFGQKAIKQDGFKNTSFTYKKVSTSQFLITGNASVTIPPAVGSGIETFSYTGTLSSAQKEDFHIVVQPGSSGVTSNKTGNVAISSGSNAVIGTGTTFLTQYNIGDYIAAGGQTRLISYIANNTYLNVINNFTATNSNSNHAMSYPSGYVIPFSNRSDRTISISGNTATISLGSNVPTSPFNIDVYYYVKRSSATPIQKNLNRNVFVKINCANNDGGAIGPWCLGIPDVYSIDGVWVSTNSYSNTGTNVKSQFTLDNGQRDVSYDLAYLSGAPGSTSNNSTILVQLSCFTYDTSQGVGYFCANSYPVDDSGAANNSIYTQNIPIYTSPRGATYDLRDCVDSRIFCTNTAAVTNVAASATVNPSTTLNYSSINLYLPVPDSGFTTDLQYYLSRSDLAVLDINGNLINIEGYPSVNNPEPPREPPLTMSLGVVKVPPYPSLTPTQAKNVGRYDYAITTSLTQNRRYTMRDIGVLDNRITNLEYYTSLSLLEQSAAALLVRSSTTGQNRFQNGIFVDPFKGFDLTNTIDPNFYAAIDPTKALMRPGFQQIRTQPLMLDETRSSGVQQHGELILLNHTSNTVYISQPYASKYRNCIEGNVYEWTGTITLTPPGIIAPDTSLDAPVINNIDLASNWVNLSNTAWGTQWGAWTDVGAPTVNVVTTSTSTTSGLTSSTSNNTLLNVLGGVGGQYITGATQTTTTTNQLQQQNSQQLSATVAQTQSNLGTFVNGVTILPYLKPIVITFEAHGMKPNTRVYAYFANVPVSNCCTPGEKSGANTIPTGVMGAPLYTDNTGSIVGWFYLPPNTFASEDNVFMLNDISDLTQGADAIQTRAQTTWYGSKLSITLQQSILNTRNSNIQIDTTVTPNTVSNTVVTQYIPPPFITPDAFPLYDGSVGGGSGGPGGCGAGAGNGADCGADGGGGGGGDGGGSSSIICTTLYKLGLMDEETYKLDEAYGVMIRKTDPELYYGYLNWAHNVVNWMNGINTPNVCFWISDEKKRLEANKNFTIKVVYALATPWAQHMKHVMGSGKDNLAGRYLLKFVGKPLSRISKRKISGAPVIAIALPLYFASKIFGGRFGFPKSFNV